MKKIIIASAAALLISTPAFAYNDDHGHDGGDNNNDNVNTLVQSICTLSGQDPVVTLSSAIADGSTGKATVVSKDDQITIKCNQKFKLDVKSDNGFLRNGNRTASQSSLADSTYSNFASAIDYTLATDISSGGSTTLTSAGNGSGFASGGTSTLRDNANPTWGDVKLTYTSVAGNAPLLVGTYADQVTLTLTGQGL